MGSESWIYGAWHERTDHQRLKYLQVSQDEQKAVINAFKDKDAVQASGVRLAGQKYFTLSASDRSVYVKKQVRCNAIELSE